MPHRLVYAVSKEPVSAKRTPEFETQVIKSGGWDGRLFQTKSGHLYVVAYRTGPSAEWAEVPANRMADSLNTNQPVCWNCHVAETFRRAYPGMVTDRPWPKHSERRAR